jgi:hypothetical protein
MIIDHHFCPHPIGFAQRSRVFVGDRLDSFQEHRTKDISSSDKITSGDFAMILV